MSFDAVRCPQCLFVSRQLGEPTPCLLHVSLTVATEADSPRLPADVETDHDASSARAPAGYDEPYVVGQQRLSVDRRGPFSLREYGRLLVLRGRVGDARLDRANGTFGS